MSVCQVALIIPFLVTTAAAQLNSTTCNDITGNVTARTCVQQCLSTTNSSCDVRCSGQAQTNVTSCFQTCNTRAEHEECNVGCVATAGHCEQKLNSGAATCAAFDCSQSCEQISDDGKCSLECVSGRRCYQQCIQPNQCTLSCRTMVEYCQQEISLSPRPKRAVCNSTHCLQRCDSRTTCECGGTNCNQECYDRGCNMTCHRGVSSCTQHCPHGGCRLACFAQKCVTRMPVPPSVNSTPTLKTTVTDRVLRTTLRSDITRAAAFTIWTEVWMASSVQAAVSMTTSIAKERSTETSVLHVKTEDKNFNTIILAVVIPLIIVIVILLILIGYLGYRLKRLKNTGYISTIAETPGDIKEDGVQLVPLMEETPEDIKEDGVRLVPLMEETPDTKVESWPV